MLCPTEDRVIPGLDRLVHTWLASDGHILSSESIESLLKEKHNHWEFDNDNDVDHNSVKRYGIFVVR